MDSCTSKFLFEISEIWFSRQGLSLSSGMHIFYLVHIFFLIWLCFLSPSPKSLTLRKLLVCQVKRCIWSLLRDKGHRIFYCLLQKLVLDFKILRDRKLLVIFGELCQCLNTFFAQNLDCLLCFCLSFLKIQLSISGSCTILLKLEVLLEWTVLFP